MFVKGTIRLGAFKGRREGLLCVAGDERHGERIHCYLVLQVGFTGVREIRAYQYSEGEHYVAVRISPRFEFRVDGSTVHLRAYRRDKF